MLTEELLIVNKRINTQPIEFETLTDTSILVTSANTIDITSFILKKTQKNDKSTCFSTNIKLDILLHVLNRIYHKISYSSAVEIIFLEAPQLNEETRVYFIPALVKIVVEGLNRLFGDMKPLEIDLISIYNDQILRNPQPEEISVSKNFIFTAKRGEVVYFESFGEVDEYLDDFLYAN